MSMLGGPQLRRSRREAMLRIQPSRLKLKQWLSLILPLTFFLFCPLWSHPFMCGLSTQHNLAQSPSPERSIFNMPGSLMLLAMFLVILASFGFLEDGHHPHVARAPIDEVPIRAPPLRETSLSRLLDCRPGA